MTTLIDVETLREWLDQQRPVTIVDVRADADRAQWAIPGSVHVNALDALRTGAPGPLADFDARRDRPLVTVCYAGRTSRIAADVLAARGYDARSLIGGMQAWSLAWNVADVDLPASSASVVQVRRTGKGCLSYLVASAGEAIVIDPSLDPQVYLDLARARGWRLGAVVDTHVHADHLSRARRLAEAAGARLMLPQQRRVTYAFEPLDEGGTIRVGDAALGVLRTPGHTHESSCYLLDGVALFSGDTLFVDGIGRPDLHADAAQARERAAALFDSLQRLAALPGHVLVLPGHYGQPIPFDRRPIAADIATLRPSLAGWLAAKAAFVDRVTANPPPPPANVHRIIELNERGEIVDDDPATLEAGANRCAIR